MSDMRVVCPNGLGTYPDIAVACPPKFEDEREDTLLNPVVLVEVLSPSTEASDRGKKFHSYATLPSLRDYVLVAQDACLVEHFARQVDSDQWLLTRYEDPATLILLPTIDVSLSLTEIYSQVDLREETGAEAKTDDADPAASR